MMAKPNEKPAGGPRLVARTARHHLVDISHRPPPIAVADVMTALGGRPLGLKPGDDNAPVALPTIRDALMRRLRTTLPTDLVGRRSPAARPGLGRGGDVVGGFRCPLSSPSIADRAPAGYQPATHDFHARVTLDHSIDCAIGASGLRCCGRCGHERGSRDECYMPESARSMRWQLKD
jgi:hypothetical protein